MIRAGAAKADITPEIGCTLAGHLLDVPSNGVLDPLFARAVVLEDADKWAALVSCDLIAVPAELTVQVADRIQEKAGIPRENVKIAVTHTHSGPPTRNRPTVTYKRSEKYFAELRVKLEEVILKAKAGVRPVEIGVGTGAQDGISWNSRPMLKDGTPAWYHPSPDEILRPTGPCDHSVTVISFKEPGGDRVAVLYNFACHANASQKGQGGKVSADFPGAAGKVIEEEIGGLALFLRAPAGNIHPSAYGDSHGMGRTLGKTVVKIAKDIAHRPCAGIRSLKEDIVLPVREHRPEEVRQIDYLCEKVGRSPARAQALKDYFHKHMAFCDDLRKRQGRIETFLQVLAVGDTAFACIPGEFFCELGLETKEKSPWGRTIVVDLANDAVGYIPSLQGYQDGGYQPFNTTVGRGAGEEIVARMLDMLGRCKGCA